MSGKRKPLGPVAADESKDPNPFWEPDPCDDVIPPKGFISDMVYYARGREVPTLFTIWTSLFALSSALKREVWIRWADERFYTNYYIIIVGPAGIVKKNTALTQANRTLASVQDLIENPIIRMRKRIEMLSGTVSPEALLESLSEAEKHRKQDILKAGKAAFDGEGVPYKATCELAISLYEMATTIGKRSYQEGMIEKLLDLYDTQDRVIWKTVSRKTVALPFTHTTLCALTTAAGFKNSIPPVATSDGFLSRCVVVYQPDTARCFPEPIVPEKAPKIPDLRQRLSLIAAGSFGEFNLDPEAKDYYYAWYRKFRRSQRLDIRYAGIRSRVQHILLKNALLIHAQRYENIGRPNLISLDEIQASERLLSRTWEESRSLISMLLEDGVPEDSARVEGILRRRGTVSRLKLLKNSHIHAEELNDAVRRLAADGKIRVTIRSVETDQVGRSTEETYHYIDPSTSPEEDDTDG